MGMEDGSSGQPFDVVDRTDTRQRPFGGSIKRFTVRPTRAFRSFSVATPLGERAIHWPALSGSQGHTARVSPAAAVVVDLGNCLSCLALALNCARPRSGYSHMAAG